MKATQTINGKPKVAIPAGSTLNQCPTCGELFGGIRAFDMHRTGPMGQRRCLSGDEMTAKGLKQDHRGAWGQQYGSGGDQE